MFRCCGLVRSAFSNDHPGPITVPASERTLTRKRRAVARKSRDAAVNFDRCTLCRQLFVSFDTFSRSSMLTWLYILVLCAYVLMY